MKDGMTTEDYRVKVLELELALGLDTGFGTGLDTDCLILHAAKRVDILSSDSSDASESPGLSSRLL
jgi:hypothetical protein